jgi:Tfp pilus assembly protein PilW
MKIKNATLRRRRQSGMTLTEALLASAVFSLVVIGLVYTQLFCMKFDELASSKMGASESARRDFNLLTQDIRSAKIWRIGNLSGSTFNAISNTLQQVGNAIQLSYTSDTNSWVRYYFDTSACQLCRVTSDALTPKVIAQNLTNASGQGMTFHAETYQGSNTFDLQYKYVIVANLEFAQYQYPLTKVGPGYYYDYYRMQFKVSSHNFN